MGATPRWLLVTALYPERTTTPAIVERAFHSLATAARELGIALVGGHTEITIGIDRLIQVGQMIGTCDPNDLLSLADARPDDAVILASGIAIEGTAILAREAAARLEGRISADTLRSAANMLRTPGISVLPAVRALKSAGVTIRGMHDPTEGGLATALAELATASGLGIEIDQNAIQIRPETAAICEALDLDPLGLIASGALLAVVSPESADTAVSALEAVGIQGAQIGRMTVTTGEHWMLTASGQVPLPSFAVDEIARFFAS
jgi:hydrogenase maturation factor